MLYHVFTIFIPTSFKKVAKRQYKIDFVLYGISITPIGETVLFYIICIKCKHTHIKGYVEFTHY